jgi:Domain of unknown function (DUF4149)
MIGDRTMMPSLLSLIALSAWLGAAILVAAVVAPAAFAVLPTRTLAGALVGRVLPVLFLAGAAVGILVAVLARGHASASPRIVAAVAMVIGCLAAQFLVAPRIERVRVAADGPIDRLAPGDPRRAAFGRLHGVSVALLGVAALAGAAALVLTLRALPLAAARDGTPTPSLEH